MLGQPNNEQKGSDCLKHLYWYMPGVSEKGHSDKIPEN